MAAVGGAGGGGGNVMSVLSDASTKTLTPPQCYSLIDGLYNELVGFVKDKPPTEFLGILISLKEIVNAIKENRAPPGTDIRYIESRNYITDEIINFTDAIEKIRVFQSYYPEDIIIFGFKKTDDFYKETRVIIATYDAILRCISMTKNGSVQSVTSAITSTPPSAISDTRKNRRNNRRKSRNNRRKSRKSRRRKNY
jgi:hypothetical protein